MVTTRPVMSVTWRVGAGAVADLSTCLEGAVQPRSELFQGRHGLPPVCKPRRRDPVGLQTFTSTVEGEQSLGCGNELARLQQPTLRGSGHGLSDIRDRVEWKAKSQLPQPSSFGHQLQADFDFFADAQQSSPRGQGPPGAGATALGERLLQA